MVEEDGNYYFRTLLENKVYRGDIPPLSHVQSLYTGNRTFFKEYKLTLFTCTYGGKSRVTVYCDKIYAP